MSGDNKGFVIDEVPAGAVVEAIDGLSYRVRLPDGTIKHVSVVMGHPVKVVKTIFPPDATIEIDVGTPKREGDK
jgi:hypothetical protein